MSSNFRLGHRLVGVFTFLLSICCFLQVQGQTLISGQINTYARVTAIGGANLTITNVNGGPLPFVVTFNNGNGTGNRAILIQMRGAAVNAAAAVTSSAHGDLTNLNTAGNWEWVEVIAAVGSLIVINAPPTLSYDPAGGDVQIVHVPYYAGVNVVVNGNLTAPPFSLTGGTLGTGGVLALAVERQLQLAADVEANGDGFLGGTPSNVGGAAACNNTTFASAFGGGFSRKGASVAAFTANDGAIGNWASGGGGANRNNAGGGGGGNFTNGGVGAWGRQGSANCNVAPAGGGEAGVALDYSTGKMFLGGGGGGGEGGTAGTAGGNGGGIVILRAGTLAVTGNRTISANGSTAADSPTDAPGGPGLGSDGAGGGGAGGAVILDIAYFNLPGSPGCAPGSISVHVNGGNGGNSIGTDGEYRGGGAGGGSGYIGLTNTAVAGQCITFSATAGTAGTSCTTCGSVGGSSGTTPGSPTSGPVIPTGSLPPLPVRLVSLSAERVGTNVALTWVTASELNNSHFTVERSRGGDAFQMVGTVPGAGTTQLVQTYRMLDPEVGSGELRYRLRQIDFDGTEHLYGPVRVSDASGHSLRVLRNPIAAGEPVSVEVVGLAGLRVELVDLAGKPHASQLVSTSAATLVQLYSAELAPGLYLLRVVGTSLAERVVIR